MTKKSGKVSAEAAKSHQIAAKQRRDNNVFMRITKPAIRRLALRHTGVRRISEPCYAETRRALQQYLSSYIGDALTLKTYAERVERKNAEKERKKAAEEESKRASGKKKRVPTKKKQSKQSARR